MGRELRSASCKFQEEHNSCKAAAAVVCGVCFSLFSPHGMASLDDCCGSQFSVLRISVFETGNWGGGGDPWSLLTTKDRRRFL